VKRPLVAMMMMISSALVITVFLPTARPVRAGGPTNAQAVADLSKAADYCVGHGGEVDVRESLLQHQ
jgi:hypothetical protein